MLREKTIVCIGIFLVLAVLTSCAFLCGAENAPAANRVPTESRLLTMTRNAEIPGEIHFATAPRTVPSAAI